MGLRAQPPPDDASEPGRPGYVPFPPSSHSLRFHSCIDAAQRECVNGQPGALEEGGFGRRARFLHSYTSIARLSPLGTLSPKQPTRIRETHEKLFS